MARSDKQHSVKQGRNEAGRHARRTLIDVSQNADDSEAARKKFRDEVVSVLLGRGVVPLEASKTELDDACRK